MGHERKAGGSKNEVKRLAMFFFFSNRMGCLGSIVVSVLASVLLIAAVGGLRGCG